MAYARVKACGRRSAARRQHEKCQRKPSAARHMRACYVTSLTGLRKKAKAANMAAARGAMAEAAGAVSAGAFSARAYARCGVVARRRDGKHDVTADAAADVTPFMPSTKYC